MSSEKVKEYQKKYHKEYHQARYKSNRNYFIEKAKAGRKKRFQKFLEIYGPQMICECGEKDKRCIDWHHVDPKTKTALIPYLVKYRSWKLVEEEIKKCIPICANCHRKLHYSDFFCAID
jgi:hypothetical protein